MGEVPFPIGANLRSLVPPLVEGSGGFLRTATPIRFSLKRKRADEIETTMKGITPNSP
jgi:hypothetical protein